MSSATLNLGILAHVDAGKTSLTEQLLYAAGVIDTVGRVDHGTTTTDSLPLEQRRGITIKSAVVSFALGTSDGELTVNVVDTPGHPDFIAEVERVLAVLDAVVLVVSAVEGVQAQTRILIRAVQRLAVPVVVFVNKTDRAGADPDRVAREVLDRLGDGDVAVVAGSALTGSGVDALMTLLPSLRPTSATHPDAALSALVFKVERGTAGEKLALVRVFDGTLRVRDRLPMPDGTGARVTDLAMFEAGTTVRTRAVGPGRIARVRGLESVRIGDPLGHRLSALPAYAFAPPTLETVVEPCRRADRGRLHVALTQLTEQDPLIGLRRDERRDETSLSLFGEVQKEVVEATLVEEYGVAVTFRESTTICVERVVGVGQALEVIAVAPNPFLATVGLAVAPAPVGSGVVFELGVERGAMPAAFFAAVEETVHQTLREGLHGWEVPDCRVTMTHSGYWPRQSHAHATFDKSMSSTAGDFRSLTPLVLVTALRRAGTQVCEPVHRFGLELPADLLGGTLAALGRLGAVPLETEPAGDRFLVRGTVPAARVHRLQQELPGLTRGEGELTTEFDRHAPVAGPVPSRARTAPDALVRAEYLLEVVRRV